MERIAWVGLKEEDLEVMGWVLVVSVWAMGMAMALERETERR